MGSGGDGRGSWLVCGAGGGRDCYYYPAVVGPLPTGEPFLFRQEFAALLKEWETTQIDGALGKGVGKGCCPREERCVQMANSLQVP